MRKKKTKIEYYAFFYGFFGDSSIYASIYSSIYWLLILVWWFLSVLAAVLFLIPPIIGVIFFLLNVFGAEGRIIELFELSEYWNGGDGFKSVPIYLGLMAIAGAIMSYGLFKLFSINDSVEKEEWEEDK